MQFLHTKVISILCMIRYMFMTLLAQTIKQCVINTADWALNIRLLVVVVVLVCDTDSHGKFDFNFKLSKCWDIGHSHT